MGCTRRPRLKSPPPDLAMAIRLSMGKAMAVVINPKTAGVKLEPEFMPSIGGKMRLPAPKKKDSSINPKNKGLVDFVCVAEWSLPMKY